MRDSRIRAWRSVSAAGAAIAVMLALAAPAGAVLDEAAMVRDPATALATGLDPEDLSPFGAGVIFRGDDGTTGDEPWRSDGTAAGTERIKDIVPGPNDSLPGTGDPEFVTIGDVSFFAATDNPVFDDFELWKTDGTAAGTVRVAAIDPDPDQGSEPRELTAVGDTLFFVANDGTHRDELWRSDGTAAGTRMVKDINPTPGDDSDPRDLTAIGGQIYFTARNATDGQEPWISDGTEAGTRQIADIRPGAGFGSQPHGYTAIGGKVVFSAQRENGNSEPWITDGTLAGTGLLKEVYPGTGPAEGSHPGLFAAFDSSVFFVARDDTTGSELWRTDGTAAGTNRVIDLNPGTETGVELSNATLVPLGDRLYFRGVDGPAMGSVPLATDWELWRTDGTEAGTERVADTLPGPNGGGAQGLVALGNDSLFFNAYSKDPPPPLDQELWRSDGTTAGTARVADINPGPADSNLAADGPTPAGDVLFFSADDGTHGSELWLVDTAAPATEISGGPAEGEHIASKNVTFELDSPTPDLDRFECSQEGGPFATCRLATPAAAAAASESVNLPPQPDGPHTFAARGVDLRGHVGDSVSRSFVVDTTAPALKILGKKLKLSKKGKTVAKLRCPDAELTGPCAGKLKLKTRKKVRLSKKGKKRKVVLASKKFRIEAGQRKKVGLKLAKRKRKLVGKRGLKVVGKATVADALTNKRKISKKLNLVKKRKRKR